ncbi:MAG TPA: peptide MFS transporter [Saprospiraceae bacterium]|nr:peptide MFS transporter [Saprospiraceae bacterium]
MSNQSGHPKGLYLLFFTEMWERFSYYGMRAILVLFLTKQLAMDKAFSSELYGSFTGLVYLTPIIGGYMADRYWGNRRSIIVGGLLMAAGQFMLYFSGEGNSQMLMYLGLGLLVFGNGFFKPNISTMVGQLYPENDKRLDSAYTVFYMGINLGAFIAPLICGYLGENVAFKWGFLAAGVGMLISTASFHYLKNKYLISPDGYQIGVEPNKARLKSDESQVESGFDNNQLMVILLGTAVLFALFHFLIGFDVFGSLIFAFAVSIPATIILDKSLNSTEKDRIWVIFIAAFFVIFFWSAFEQAGASLTFFADEQTNRTIFGWEMPASWFNSFNAVFIVVFAPVFSALWLKMGDKQPASPTKQAIGLLLLAAGYLYISFGVKDVAEGTKVSIMWLTGLYLIHTFGELCLSPIGLSMVNKLSPARLASLLMGVWFLANATANKFAGMLSALYPEKGKSTSFLGYMMNNTYDFFLLFVVMSGLAGIILLLLSKWIQKMMHGIK